MRVSRSQRLGSLVPVLPTGAGSLPVEGQSQGGAPAAERERTTLTLAFHGDRIARRWENGPTTGAGAESPEVRNGWVAGMAAGAG